MRILIVETGKPPAGLDARYGRYADMFEQTLGAADPALNFSRTSAFEGEALPDPATPDGVVVTGSPAGVYEDHEWIGPLEAFIRGAAEARTPTFGVCFGHQAITQAFGGAVVKSEKGWGVGVHTYEALEPAGWMSPPLPRFSCAVSHQDQVTTPPEGARRLAGSNFCPHGMLAYAQGPVASLQPHPEFAHDFATELLSLREDRIADEVASLGRASLERDSDRAAISKWITTFFRTHAKS